MALFVISGHDPNVFGIRIDRVGIRNVMDL